MIAGALFVGLCSANAQVVYDNTVNDLGVRFQPLDEEVGDQIILASTGYLTNFSFQYFGYNSVQQNFSGNVQANVRFYMMNGPVNSQGYATPGVVPLWESGWFNISTTPEGRATMNFLAGQDFAPQGLFLPITEITWSVQFQGTGAGDFVGLDVYSPPTIGQSYPDYWERDSSLGWVLKTNSVPMNFSARFIANIPEPSSISLLVLGGLAAFLIRRRQG